MNELDKLFESLPKDEKQQDNFLNPTGQEEPKKEEPKEEPKDDLMSEEDKGKEPYKNRRHRRLEAQLQKERDARIRAEALAEARIREEIPDEDIDPRWVQIYGDSPETRLAWKLQQEILQEKIERVKEQTLEDIRREREEAEQLLAESEELIDSELEFIEEEFNIDITSDSPSARKTRREFLEMVEKLSPKDSEGNIVDYADFQSVWELYQAKKSQDNKPDSSRNKEIAAKSLPNNNTSTTPGKEITPGFRGWQKDYGIN